MSGLICEYCFHQTGGFSHSATRQHTLLFFFFKEKYFAITVLATTWLIFKHVGYGHKGIKHVRDTSLYIKTLPRSYLLLLKNKFVSLSQEGAQGR